MSEIGESGDKCQAAISPRPNLAIFLRKCQIELEMEPSKCSTSWKEIWRFKPRLRFTAALPNVTLFAFNVIGINYKVIILWLFVIAFCQEMLEKYI